MQKPKQKPKLPISKRAAREILIGVLPALILHLAKIGKLNEADAKDAGALFRLFRKHKKEWDNADYSVSVEDEFVREAETAWKRDKKFVAVVLFATAIEHHLNYSYRLAFEAYGFSHSDITRIIKAQNTDAKLSMDALIDRSFPKPLLKRIRAIFAIRNAIVHFKAEPGRLDSDDDSYSKIQADIKRLPRFSIRGDFESLRHHMWNRLTMRMPHLEIAATAVRTLQDALKKKGK